MGYRTESYDGVKAMCIVDIFANGTGGKPLRHKRKSPKVKAEESPSALPSTSQASSSTSGTPSGAPSPSRRLASRTPRTDESGLEHTLSGQVVGRSYDTISPTGAKVLYFVFPVRVLKVPMALS